MPKMQGTHFSQRQRSYLFLPSFQVADPGAGGDYYTLNHTPLIGFTETLGDLKGAKQFLGAAHSVRTANPRADNATRMYTAGYNTVPTTSAWIPAAGNNKTGIELNATHLTEAGTATTGFATLTRGLINEGYGLATRVIAGGSDNITGAASVYAIGASHILNHAATADDLGLPTGTTNSVGYNLESQLGNATHDQGIVAGGLTIYPMCTVLGDITTTGEVRRMQALTDMRLYGVLFGAQASGAGNSVRLINASDGVNITENSALVGVSGPSTWVGCETAAMNGEYRDIKRGDILTIQANHGGSGNFTNLFAWLVVAVRSHISDDARRIHTRQAVSAALTRNNARSWTECMSSVRGPMLGGWAYIPFGASSLAGGETGTKMTRLRIPFDCHVIGANFNDEYTWDTPAAARRVVSFYNTTKSQEVATVDLFDNCYYGANYSYYYQSACALSPGWTDANWPVGAVSNPSLSRGDYVEFRGTSHADEAFVRAQGGLYVIPQGFPGDTAVWD